MKKVFSRIFIVILILGVLASLSFLVYRTEKIPSFNTYVNKTLIFFGVTPASQKINIADDFSKAKNNSSSLGSLKNKKLLIPQNENKDYSDFVNNLSQASSLPSLPESITVDFVQDGYSVEIKKNGILVGSFVNDYPLLRQLFCFSDGMFFIDFSGKAIFLEVLAEDVIPHIIKVDFTQTVIAPKKFDLSGEYIKVYGRNGQNVVYKFVDDVLQNSESETIQVKNSQESLQEDCLYKDLFPSEKAWEAMCFFSSNYFDTSSLAGLKNPDSVGTFPFINNTFLVSESSPCTLGKFCTPSDGTYTFTLYDEQSFLLQCWAFVAVFNVDGTLIDCNVEYSAEEPTVTVDLKKDDEVFMLVSFMGNVPSKKVFAGCELKQ